MTPADFKAALWLAYRLGRRPGGDEGRDEAFARAIATGVKRLPLDPGSSGDAHLTLMHGLLSALAARMASLEAAAGDGVTAG